MRRQGVVRCPGCGLWSRFQTDRFLVDRVCIKCGKRTRAQLDRKGYGKSSTLHSQGRGRPRATEVRDLPLHMPREAVKKMVRDLNQWERRGRRQAWRKRGGQDTFIPASEILNEKEERTNIREMDPEKWKEIQSLDDFLAEEWGGN